MGDVVVFPSTGPTPKTQATLDALWAAYRETDRYRRAPKTTRIAYGHVVERALAELPARFEVADVERWLAKVSDEGKSVATRNKYLRYLRAVCGHGARLLHDHYAHDVLMTVSLCRQEKRRRRCPPDEAVHALRALVKAVTDEHAAVRLGIYAGLRIGEILAARPSDLAMHGHMRILHVRRTRDKYGERPRKNHYTHPHVVELDDTGAELLAELGIRAGVDDGHLFAWPPSRPNNLMERWHRQSPLVATEIPNWHSMRHWGATRVLRKGGTLAELQAWLGDATPQAAATYVDEVRGTTHGLAHQLAMDFEGESEGGDSPGPWGNDP